MTSGRPSASGEPRPDSYTRRVADARTAVILTVGNEVISGDVENTNGSWLARRLATLGIEVHLLATLRDEIDVIAAFLDQHAALHELVIVTGGLGGTPDDITREAVAAAFGVEQASLAELAARLHARFEPHGLGDYAARWANIPDGADPIDNPLGGAPGFVLENVYALPGLPSEMEAMFESIEERFKGEPIATWRCRYETGEGQIVDLLEEATRMHAAVSVGSYPRFGTHGPTVEIVLKSTDGDALEDARDWFAERLDGRARPTR